MEIDNFYPEIISLKNIILVWREKNKF